MDLHKRLNEHMLFVYSLFSKPLISVAGGRFPRAWLEPPRRKLLRGLKAHAFPAGVAAFHLNQTETHYFDIEKCKVCHYAIDVTKKVRKVKTYSVSLNSETHEEQPAYQKTDEFIQLAKELYKVEAKNSELKNGHGYNTASSAGLYGIEI